MVTDGCKWCVSDMKTYYRIRRDLSQGRRTLTDLTTDELESYVQCPPELAYIGLLLFLLQIPIVGETIVFFVILICFFQTSEEFAKLSGIVCLAVLPMTVYVIGFAILFFPRIILTRHFWSNEQRKEFWAHSLKVSAARHYQPILENLKVSNKDITIPTEFVNLKDVKIAPLIEFPYSHIVRLCMIHRCFPVPSVKRLAHRAEVLRELDSRQLNDLHLVDEMDDQQLYMHLFIRRLQYEGKTVPEMRELLKTWLIASKVIPP
ncbi:hypothetical protein L596_007394 [Steinernema carpocapsae]|uniref:Letm1 RBD domain-containing protein n=1 Tax=Steinernema carpocapsae TaxID=34508 RepID=A0A4U5P979_STECR|nr:hypothetical protein L596_007394 [Steinernema carpocapsae]